MTARAALRPGMNAADSLALALLGGAAKYDEKCRLILERDDPEDVHAARVTLRRMRAILRGFGDMLAVKPAGQLKELLASLFRELGPLRDADVQAAALDGAAGRRKAAAAAELRSEVRALLASRDSRPLSVRVERFLADPDRLFRGGRRRRLAAAPVWLIATRAMQVALTELLAFGKDLDALTAEDLHDFRKRAKDLRYLTELFIPLCPAGEASRMLKQLKVLQDALGTLNDLHVMAEDAGPALPGNAPQQEAKARKAVNKTWARLAESPVWWLGPGR